MGVKQDLFTIGTLEEHTTLREHFADEPMFMQVIDVLLALDQGTKLKDWKQAHHNMVNYQIDDDKLWFIGGGTKIRARPQ